jgi:Tol biopolymer transport system component
VDIWAFGCVLYEMLTGRASFAGDDLADIIAAVIHKQPDYSALPRATPSAVRAVLLRCFDKDPKNRLRDIGEARIAIDSARSDEDAVPGSFGVSRSTWIAGGVAAAATVGALVSVAWPRDAASGPVLKFSLSAPDNTTFPIPAAMMALSPDGRQLAFVAIDAQGRRTLWHKSLDGEEPVSFPGTDGASDPFWSPDSRSVGYFTDNAMSAVEIRSGRIHTIRQGGGSGGTWRDDGLIVFSTGTGLYSVPASGGESFVLVDANRAPGQRRWHSPKFLPDGRHILYVAVAEDSPDFRAYITAVEAGEPRYLMDVQSKVEYVDPGWIFFVANGRLLSQRFDTESLTFSGPPLAVAGDLLGAAANARKAFTASGGILAFREAPGNGRLEMRDRTGKLVSQIGRTRDLYPIALSADDKRLLFRRNGDVWSHDLTNGRETRITFDSSSSSEGVFATPVWSPDGQWIAFRRAGRVIRIRSDGSGEPEDIGAAHGALTQWTADGTALMSEPGGNGALTLIRLRDPRRSEPVEGPPTGAREGQISPDGKWIAYAYAERGDFQIYVESVATRRGRWQVSQNGGRQPKWRRDGRELFYISADGTLSAAEIRTDSGFAVTSTRPLFDVGATTGLPSNIGFYYDVTSDGQRFVFSTDFYEQIRTPISVIVNWQEELKRLVPTS